MARSLKRPARWIPVLALLLGFGGCSESGTNPDLEGPTRIFSMHHEDPAWGPNGLIAYFDHGLIRTADGDYAVEPVYAGIWVLNPDTMEKRRIVPTGRFPVWSADGAEVAFVAGGIFAAALDDSSIRLVTPVASACFFLSWSDQGPFALDDGHEMWVVNVDGTDLRRIVPVEGGYARMPSWSIDGTHVLHIRYGHPEGIFVMTPEGTDLQKVSAFNGYDRNPEYSPDGSQVAFSSQSRNGGLSQVWVMEADGTNARQITQHGGADPSWSPDGSQVVFVREEWYSDAPGAGVLWCVDVATGDERQLTTKRGEVPGLVYQRRWP